MGSGTRGVKDIKNHPYFASVDWELLEQKHVEPPFKPSINTSAHNDTHRYATFEALLTDIGKSSWSTEYPDPEDQEYFSAWYVRTYVHVQETLMCVFDVDYIS